jgi:hypothetical protein
LSAPAAMSQCFDMSIAAFRYLKTSPNIILYGGDVICPLSLTCPRLFGPLQRMSTGVMVCSPEPIPIWLREAGYFELHPVFGPPGWWIFRV